MMLGIIRHWNTIVQTDRQTGRNVYLDVVKYVAIFLVVWGHVVQQTSLVSCWPVQEDPLMRLIYTMHMPLFMGICGYFFCRSVRKFPSVKSYVQHKLLKRLLGLLIPMMSFGLLKVLLDVAMGKEMAGAVRFLKEWYWAAKGVWFLGDIAVNTLIVLLVLHFCTGRFRQDWKYFLLALPLTFTPYISYKSPHMYLYFALGYWVAAYLPGEVKRVLPLGKYALGLFLIAYLAFSNMPWPPEDVWFDYHQQSVTRLVVNDSLKVILGITGTFVALVVIYRLLPYLQHSWFYSRAAIGGRFTLDIYLLQILFVEKIAGTLHKNWVAGGGMDIFNSNFVGRILMTLVAAWILMELLSVLSYWLNCNRILAKVLFYRDVS